ncbi:hypothetical protein [Vibrio diabolicus]|nr:hypothetical protein [Vibrio diabolicus]
MYWLIHDLTPMVVKRDLVVQTVPYATQIASGQNFVSDFAKGNYG